MPSIDSLSIQITASTGSAARKIDALTESLYYLKNAINRLDVSKFETLEKAVNGLSQGLASLKGTGVKQIEKVGKALDSVNESAKNDTLDAVAKDVKKVSNNSKEASENIDKVSNTLNSGFNANATDEMAKSMERVSETVQKTASQMGAFKSTLAKLKIIIPTEGLEKVDKRIEQLQERIDDLKDRMDFKSAHVEGYVDGKDIEKDKEKIDGLIVELERLKLKKQELESHGGFKLNLGATISNLSKGFEAVNKKLDGFISKMRKAKAHTKETAKSTENFSLASMRLAKELTRVTKMLKLMITRMVLRKVIQNAIDGFKNLVQYSSEVDASVSLMWNSFRQLGNSVAAAVGPLINALAPALNYIIQLCIKVANAINQVISALTGRSTWTRAKTLTDDYAKSLDKSNKSAKDLKRTILGFDEINKLDDNKDSGGGMTEPEDMFEDAKIEAKWADMAKKLKSILNQLLAPIKKAWTKLGDQVVAAWSGAFKSIKKLLGDIGRDFLKVWNQPRTIQMLETILRIFQDIGGVVKYLADGLDKAWNTNKTGLRILEAIRDIFLTIVTHIRNMTSATLEWAKNLNFTPLLEAFKDWVVSMKPVVDAIAGAFEDFYNRVLLPLGKWTIEKGLPELIQVFVDFNEKVQWDSLREKLATLWQHIEPFAEKVGEGLILFIRDCSDAVANFVNSDTFQKFLEKIEEWMDKVDAEDVARTIKLVAGAIITLKGALFLLEGIKGLSAIVTNIKAFLGIFEPAASFIASIKETSAAIEGMSAALQGLEGILSTGTTAHLIETFSFFKERNVKIETLEAFDKAGISLEKFNDAVYKTDTNKLHELNEEYKNGSISADEYKKSLDDLVENTTKFHVISESVDNWVKGTSAFRDSMEVTSTQMENYGKKMGWSEEQIAKYSKGIDKSYSDISKAADNLQTNVAKSTEGLKTSTQTITIEVANAQQELVGSWNEMSLDAENGMSDIKTSIDDGAVEINKSFDDIKNGMTKDKWTFSGVIEGLTKTFKDAFKGAAEWWNKFTDQVNGEHSIFGKSFTINLPKIKGFATGGFPEDDSLFFANSTEMLGKFSNGQNVVANNQQITDGIAQAVYSAIMSANGSGGATKYINNTIQIDGRAIARAVTMGQDDMNRRFSPVTV